MGNNAKEMKLQSDELAKYFLLGKVRCSHCQNHFKCKIEGNDWYCTMSEKKPMQVCEQWELPNTHQLLVEYHERNQGSAVSSIALEIYRLKNEGL